MNYKWVAVKNRAVIYVGQRADSRIRKMSTQSRKEGRRAYHVSDVVAPNNKKTFCF
jgi:hypothetical protein